jgi:hypothetical protein
MKFAHVAAPLLLPAAATALTKPLVESKKLQKHIKEHKYVGAVPAVGIWPWHP